MSRSSSSPRVPLAVIIAVLIGFLLQIASACSGGSPHGEAPTATPAATAAATAVPATATPDAAGTSRNPVPPVQATDIGRDGCPEGWLGYKESSFSVCYPPDHYAEVWAPPGVGASFSVRLVSGEPVAHTPYIFHATAVDLYEPPTECLFVAERIYEPDNASIEPYSSTNAEGSVCMAELDETLQVSGALEAPSGGIAFGSYARTDEQRSLAMDILATLRPG